MRILRPGERVTVSFKVPHPFDEALFIECSADVKIVRGQPSVMRQFYADPRDLSNTCFWNAENVFIKLPKRDPIAIQKVQKEHVWTNEEIEDAIIDQAVDNYFWNNADEILEVHGVTYEKDDEE